MIAPRVDELAHITSLQVYVRYRDGEHIEHAAEILARTPALRNLDLEFQRYNISEDSDCCDGAVGVLKGLFYSQIKKGQPTVLKSLRITSMCLLRVDRLLLTVLELDELKQLQLIRCKDINPFLRGLEPLGLALSSLCIEDFCQDKTTDPVDAIEDFIKSLKPLKRLMLTLSGVESFYELYLKSHYASLESLRIENDPSEEPINLACGHAPNLEQLALSGY
jgi:hypothetical protein